MKGLPRPQLSYANVMATFAVFLALGGGAYAATRLPAKSVGTKQLKAAAVTAAKIKDGTITGAKIDANTLGVVPAAQRAGQATSAASAERATSAAEADHATSAGRADVATSADHADDAELLNGIPSGGFVAANQTGYIDRTFSGCTLSVICVEDLLTIAGVKVRVTCENAAGVSGVILRVIGGARTGYSYVTGTTEARHGSFEGDGNVVAVTNPSSELKGATGTIVVRTPARIISIAFDASARAPTVPSAECTVAATALAI